MGLYFYIYKPCPDTWFPILTSSSLGPVQIQGLAYQTYNPVPTMITIDLMQTVLARINPYINTMQDTPQSIRVILPVSLVFTNLTATLLIAKKACSAWQIEYKKPSRADTDTLSPVWYNLLHSVEMPAVFNSGYQASVNNYLDLILPHLETIYPTAIILLSHLYKNQQDSILKSLSQSLEFAAPAPSSQSDPPASTQAHDTQDGENDIQEVSRGDSVVV
ncbi:hypothetical protein D9758_016966 [Tetrapyrgos nigripes]|uniref:Uncharacterized protein n=1 Tax=Tetrapyrgos nigripes TaxID=182062 RepID=A0A8H5CB93_9AGAR|nr:hypothetical protein D9758_016966 [Tetrapyrgos nigripes]